MSDTNSKEIFEITKLDGANFSLWEFGLTFLLEAKELTGFIDGSEKEPDKETKKAEWKVWKQKRSQTAVILLSSIEKSLHQHLINCRNPEEIWNKVIGLYGSTKENSKDDAWEKFYSFRFSEGVSINLQIEKFESIVKKLIDAGENLSDSSITNRLLNVLPARFSGFRMTWDATPESERSLGKLTTRLIREDKRLSETEKSAAADLALQVQALNIGKAKHSGNFNKFNRDERRKEIEELKKRTKCGYCKEVGHWVRECPKLTKNQTQPSVFLSTATEGECIESNDNQILENVMHAYSCDLKNDSVIDEYILKNVIVENAYFCDASGFYANTSENKEDFFLADSGASMHMTYRRDFFSEIKNVPPGSCIKVADDKRLPATGIGNIKIREMIDNKVFERVLTNVLFVPDLKRNLFSIGAVNDKGFSFHSYRDRCEVRDKNGKITSLGVRYGTLFRMLFDVGILPECNLAGNLMLWHERMGHVNVRSLLHTTKMFEIDESALKCDKEFFCETCVLSKQTRKPHVSLSHRGDSKFGRGEKIRTDVAGPVNIESPRGSKYFVLFKDEYTGYRKVYFLRHKSEALLRLKEFETFIFTQTSNKIKVIRSDNGTEYKCNDFDKFIKEKGIIHEFSSPYIHEQNGRAERDIRTVIECARSMLICKNVNLELWPEAVNTACYILNRTIMKENENKTPFEKMFGKPPKIKHLRVFGTTAYLHIPNINQKKFSARSRKMLFVGYDNESSNFRLWDKDTRKIYVSSDVSFCENPPVNKIENAKKSAIFNIDFGEPDSIDNNFNTNCSNEELCDSPANEINNGDTSVNFQNNEVMQNLPEICNPPEKRELRNRSLIQPIDRYGVAVAFIADAGPQTFAEAISNWEAEKWMDAMKDEIQALKDNDTWTLMALPKGKKPISCKWIYTIKNDANKPVRYKARLVARGFSQREGIDYFDTFAPVVRYESIRILFAIAAEQDLEMQKFDVKTAFLYGELDEEIYLEQPQGFVVAGKENLVCKLHKSLYGLKQSPRCWNKKFVAFLIEFRFTCIDSDKCIFIGVVYGFIVYLALYVDDGLVISKSKYAIDKVLHELKCKFEITMGDVNEFIGMEVKRDREKCTIKINQPEYIKKILAKFGMDDANSSYVPAEPGLYLNKNPKNVKSKIPYREAVGSLLFAARVTRPDIEYAVNYLSQFVDSHGQEHWQALKRIMRYLAGTIDFGIVYGSSGSNNKFELKGFTDADYAGCLDTRRSRSGYVFTMNDAPITWSSQRQPIVSLSTTEAEYIALTHATKEVIWLQRMLSELNIECITVPMYVDNRSAINLAKNADFHKRTKHIDVRFHFVREIVCSKKIKIEYVKTCEQLADLFTKPLPRTQFCNLREKLSIM